MMPLPVLLQNEYIRSGVILFSFIVLAYVLHVVLKTLLHRVAQKTKTDLDDKLLSIITKPIFFLVILIGINIGLRTLTLLQQHVQKIEDATFILAAFTIAHITSRILALFVGRWLKAQQGFEKTPVLATRFISIIVYILALLMILTHFHIEITPLLATLGIGGLAIGLALQHTLTNFFAGLHILSDRPIRVGDFVELDNGMAGYVEDIGWRSTQLKTIQDNLIIVPNGKLAESIITNTSMPKQSFKVFVQCGVAYTSDLKKVEKVTLEAAKNAQKVVPGAVKDFVPVIRFHTFADSNINFEIALCVQRYGDKKTVVHEFIKALKERYDKEGIEISWPVRKIVQRAS